MIVQKLVFKFEHRFSDQFNDYVDRVVVEQYGWPDNSSKLFARNEYGLYIRFFFHREDGPAYTEYRNGKKAYEAYYLNNLVHRVDGPAVFSCSGSVNDYVLLNIVVSKEDFNTPGFIDAFILSNS